MNNFENNTVSVTEQCGNYYTPKTRPTRDTYITQCGVLAQKRCRDEHMFEDCVFTLDDISQIISEIQPSDHNYVYGLDAVDKINEIAESKGVRLSKNTARKLASVTGDKFSEEYLNECYI